MEKAHPADFTGRLVAGLADGRYRTWEDGERQRTVVVGVDSTAAAIYIGEAGQRLRSVAVYNGTCAAVRIGEAGQGLGKVSQAFGKIVLIHNTQPFWKRSEGNPFISGYDRGRIFVPEPRGTQKAGQDIVKLHSFRKRIWAGSADCSVCGADDCGGTAEHQPHHQWI